MLISHDLTDLFFGQVDQFTRHIFRNMQIIKQNNVQYNSDHKAIFDKLDEDVTDTRRIIESYKSLQQIMTVCNEWKHGGKGQTVEMNIYQSTYKKVSS